jgi:hypothetical protein
MPIKSVARGIVGLGLIVLTASQMAPAQAAGASKKEIQRGRYLVNYGGCNDCHTPKVMSANGPVPDKSRLLSGHPADAKLAPVPSGVIGPGPDQWGAITNSGLTAWAGPWGISFAANLTPDQQTGLGGWTPELFIKTMRTGKHFGVARPLLPPMPWFSLAALSDRDLKAVFAYLKSIKPIRNQVPQPVPPQ